MTQVTGKVEFGPQILEITDPLHIQPVSCDVITEGRVFNGMVCFSFAVISTDGNGLPVATISSRIRLTLPSAMDLRNSIDNLLKAEMPGKEAAN